MSKYTEGMRIVPVPGFGYMWEDDAKELIAKLAEDHARTAAVPRSEVRARFRAEEAASKARREAEAAKEGQS